MSDRAWKKIDQDGAMHSKKMPEGNFPACPPKLAPEVGPYHIVRRDHGDYPPPPITVRGGARHPIWDWPCEGRTDPAGHSTRRGRGARSDRFPAQRVLVVGQHRCFFVVKVACSKRQKVNERRGAPPSEVGPLSYFEGPGMPS